ncbi:hypothetical protein B296_00053528, partial [Ensete ventricosum]
LRAAVGGRVGAALGAGGGGGGDRGVGEPDHGAALLRSAQTTPAEDIGGGGGSGAGHLQPWRLRLCGAPGRPSPTILRGLHQHRGWDPLTRESQRVMDRSVKRREGIDGFVSQRSCGGGPEAAGGWGLAHCDPDRLSWQNAGGPCDIADTRLITPPGISHGRAACGGKLASRGGGTPTPSVASAPAQPVTKSPRAVRAFPAHHRDVGQSTDMDLNPPWKRCRSTMYKKYSDSARRWGPLRPRKTRKVWVPNERAGLGNVVCRAHPRRQLQSQAWFGLWVHGKYGWKSSVVRISSLRSPMAFYLVFDMSPPRVFLFAFTDPP